MSVPTRKTSELELDLWNRRMRASPVYQNFMMSRGLPTDGRVKLSRELQGQLEQELARAGMPVPKGMHIDQGGNLNQKNRLVRNLAIGAGIAAGGYYAAPALFGGGAAAGAGGAAGAAGAGAGTAGALAPLATTGWVAPMAGLAAPATSALAGGGALAAGAGLAGAAAAPAIAGAGGAVAPAAAQAGGGLGGFLGSPLGTAALLGLSGVGGMMGQQQKSQSTTTPTLDPKFEPMQAQMMGMIQSRLSDPAKLPAAIGRQGIRDINRTNDLVKQSMSNSLTSRGLGRSPVAAAAMARQEGNRAGDIIRLQEQLPLLEKKFQDDDLERAMQFLQQGRGQTTNSSGSYGGGLGGGLSGLASMLGFLYGNRR